MFIIIVDIVVIIIAEFRIKLKLSRNFEINREILF